MIDKRIRRFRESGNIRDYYDQLGAHLDCAPKEDEEKGMNVRLSYYDTGPQVQCMVYVGEQGHAYRAVGRLVFRSDEWEDLRPLLDEFCELIEDRGGMGSPEIQT